MNRNILRIAVAVVLTVVVFIPTGRAATNEVEALKVDEVVKALKSHYVDADKINNQLLNDASLAGIVQALGQGVVILDPQKAAETTAMTNAAALPATLPIARAEIIDPDIGYIRLADVQELSVSALDAELKKFTDAKVSGYVLDLRFADGTNYDAAAQIASRFVSDGQILFEVKSTEQSPKVYRASNSAADAPVVGNDLATGPLMILVNSETRGGAEALAGALRAQDRCVVIGSKTAGSAVAWEDVALSDGRILRVATAKIVLPSESAQGEMKKNLFPDGVTPDISVRMDAAAEREAVLAMQTNVTLTASLQPRQMRKGMTEAELVKAFRGEAVGKPKAANEAEEEGEIQTVKDRPLQRAVDILKGIRVLLSSL